MKVKLSTITLVALLLSMAFLYMLLVPTKALACSISAPLVPISKEDAVKKKLRGADAVFVGRVLSNTPSDPGPIHRITFEVVTTWKGVNEPQVTVVTRRGGGDCGAGDSLYVDGTYLIYAYYGTGNNLTVDIFSIGDIDTDTKILGPGKRPRELVGMPTTGSAPSQLTLMLAGITLAALSITLGCAFKRRATESR
ncbi:MAG: hypothetical protein M3441_07940 [Chloroflexota bacterium]|nr:hypothetical protein [Chloroflexota bacterium]